MTATPPVARVSRKAAALAKQERLNHANDLIQLIASLGRRFFYSSSVAGPDKTRVPVPMESYASLELRRGKVYFIDYYTRKAVYTHDTPFRNEWRGFTSGGTLQGLVSMMRDYIMDGTQIPASFLPLCRRESVGFANNIWGYPAEDARKLYEAAIQMPIVKAPSQPALASS